MIDEYHVPVMVEEVLQYLQPFEDGTYIDGTIGGGGHAEKILQKLPAKGRLIGFDKDTEALAHAQQLLSKFGDKLVLVHDNIADIRNQFERLHIEKMRGLLLDLGLSSHQIDSDNRGFSFQSDSIIDMRMDREQSLDGRAVVNRYETKKLADVLWKFGEEIHSRRIARKIAEERAKEPINTTKQLARIVESVTGKKYLIKTLARVFQAIRIEVNKELDNLDKALNDAIDLLEEGGRIIVISYHSLEDRIVKRLFQSESRPRRIDNGGFTQVPEKEPRLRILTKKPVRATEAEIKQNPRARSAKLRAALRI